MTSPDPLPRQSDLTKSHVSALTTRADLLAEEAALVEERGINWRGRLAELGSFYGRSGGSALDRRLIIEAMARLEAR